MGRGIKGEVSDFSHPRTGHQHQHRAQFFVGAHSEPAGRPQLQRLAQFVEPQLAPDLEGLEPERK